MTITTTDRLDAIRECLGVITSTEHLGGLSSHRLIHHAHRIARSAKNDLNAPGDYLTPDRALALLGVLEAVCRDWDGENAEEMARRAKHNAEKIVILALREAE